MNQYQRKVEQTAKAIALGKPNIYRKDGVWTVAEFKPDITNMESYKIIERMNCQAFYWTLKQPVE